MSDDNSKKRDDRSGTIMAAMGMIGVGVVFLLINLNILPSWRDSWPIFLIAIGVAMVIGAFTRGKPAAKN
jgi:hypothetical protein